RPAGARGGAAAERGPAAAALEEDRPLSGGLAGGSGEGQAGHLTGRTLTMLVRLPGSIVTRKWNFWSSTTKVTLCLPGDSVMAERGAIGVILPVSLPSM